MDRSPTDTVLVGWASRCSGMGCNSKQALLHLGLAWVGRNSVDSLRIVMSQDSDAADMVEVA
jgi:hypothetical protein